MGNSGLKEIQVSDSLYEAYKDQLIPPSPSFDDFAKSHKVFQDRVVRINLFGMLLMSAVGFYLYKSLKNPSIRVGIRGGMGLGFCTFYMLCVMPSRPPAEVMAFVRMEGPKYLHILVKKDPQWEPIFREVFDAVPAEGTSADAKFFPSPRMARSRAETESVWEKSATQQADKEWSVEPRETKVAESPYLSPDKSECPYVYGSLSAERQGRDRSDY